METIQQPVSVVAAKRVESGNHATLLTVDSEGTAAGCVSPVDSSLTKTPWASANTIHLPSGEMAAVDTGRSKLRWVNSRAVSRAELRTPRSAKPNSTRPSTPASMANLFASHQRRPVCTGCNSVSPVGGEDLLLRRGSAGAGSVIDFVVVRRSLHRRVSKEFYGLAEAVAGACSRWINHR